MIDYFSGNRYALDFAPTHIFLFYQGLKNYQHQTTTFHILVSKNPQIFIPVKRKNQGQQLKK